MPYDIDRTNSSENKFIASGFVHQGTFGLIFLDFTTGDFFGLTFKNLDEFCERLMMMRPKEFISYMGQWDEYPIVEEYIQSLDILKTHLSTEYFEEKYTSFYIQKLIPTYQRDGIIAQHSYLLAPLGAISYYVTSTQGLELVSHLRPFRLINSDETMKVTYSTLSGLEIFPRSKDLESNSIVGFMDKTKSSMGARHLKQYFQSPLTDYKQITKRQDLIELLIKNPETLESIRYKLDEVRDIDRIMAKVSTKKVNAGDVINFARSTNVYFELQDEMEKKGFSFFQKFPKKETELLKDLAAEIIKTINDEMGAHADKGNLIRPGVYKERDRLYRLSSTASEELVTLETKYRAETGISNLKIKSNNINGYFIEVSNSHISKVPKTFMRRQTLVNNERYVTAELEDFEKEINSAQAKLTKLEKEIFETLTQKMSESAILILDLAKRLAQIDVFQSLAWVSRQEGFIRPTVSPDKKIVNIQGAWHPLIKCQYS